MMEILVCVIAFFPGAYPRKWHLIQVDIIFSLNIGKAYSVAGLQSSYCLRNLEVSSKA